MRNSAALDQMASGSALFARQVKKIIFTVKFPLGICFTLPFQLNCPESMLTDAGICKRLVGASYASGKLKIRPMITVVMYIFKTLKPLYLLVWPFIYQSDFKTVATPRMVASVYISFSHMYKELTKQTKYWLSASVHFDE